MGRKEPPREEGGVRGGSLYPNVVRAAASLLVILTGKF